MSTAATPAPSSFRPRSAFEIVDASIQLLRRNYAKLVTLSAVMYVPLVLFGLYVNVAVLQPLIASAGSRSAPPALPGGFGVLLLLYLVMGLWYVVMDTALIAASADAYLGRTISPGAAVSRAASVLVSAVVASIVKWVAIGFGMIFLFIPGLYLFAMWFAVPAATVLERLGPGQSLGRSATLSRGAKLKILGTLLVTWLIYLAVLYMLYIPVLMTGNMVLSSLVGLIVGPLVYPLIPAVTTVLYYDMRIRKEGYDIQLMSQSLDTVPAA